MWISFLIDAVGIGPVSVGGLTVVTKPDFDSDEGEAYYNFLNIGNQIYVVSKFRTMFTYVSGDVSKRLQTLDKVKCKFCLKETIGLAAKADISFTLYSGDEEIKPPLIDQAIQCFGVSVPFEMTGHLQKTQKVIAL